MLFSNKTILGLVALSALVASSAATDARRLGRRNLANAEQTVDGEDLNGRRKLGKKKEKKDKKVKVPKVKKTRAPKGTSSPKTQKSAKSGKAEGALYVSLNTYKCNNSVFDFWACVVCIAYWSLHAFDIIRCNLSFNCMSSTTIKQYILLILFGIMHSRYFLTSAVTTARRPRNLWRILPAGHRSRKHELGLRFGQPEPPALFCRRQQRSRPRISPP